MSGEEYLRDRYPMGDGNTRGFALIFVNDEFKDNTQQDPRRGGEKDYEHLTECFKKLGFRILPARNQTIEQTAALLRKFATGKQREKEHAAVVAFSTHGTQYDGRKGKQAADVVYCTDGILTVSLITSIIDESSGLKNKPKLFFFQACRGINYDDTFVKDGDYVQKVTMDLSGLKTKEISTTSTVEIPLHKDMFIACSSPPGYLSLRSITRGSFFVTALHDILMKHGNDLDLLDLMTMVTNRSLDPEFMVKPGQGEPWETNRMCTPWVTSMLLKEVWFK